MTDDWRLRVDLHDAGRAHELTERLQASELEHELRTEFSDRIVVSRDEGQVFCYAAEREQAEEVARVVRRLAGEGGWMVETELMRWHPTSQEWRPADVPLPETDAEESREHARRIAAERQESAERGFPEFEVRIRCEGRRAAGELRDRLRAEGLASVQRSHYVLIGAPDEDTAAALVQRLEGELPAGTPVAAQPSVKEILADRPPNPFAFLGGLGG